MQVAETDSFICDNAKRQSHEQFDAQLKLICSSWLDVALQRYGLAKKKDLCINVLRFPAWHESYQNDMLKLGERSPAKKRNALFSYAGVECKLICQV